MKNLFKILLLCVSLTLLSQVDSIGIQGKERMGTICNITSAPFQINRSTARLFLRVDCMKYIKRRKIAFGYNNIQNPNAKIIQKKRLFRSFFYHGILIDGSHFKIRTRYDVLNEGDQLFID